MARKSQAGEPAPGGGAAAGPGAGGGAAGAPPAKKRRSRWRLLLAAVVVVAVGVFALSVWIALTFSYSSGDRAGFVQKFSRRGWVCKSWEGDLAMVNLPGTAPEIFRFTVRDDGVAQRITQSMGQRVALHYEQHLGVPTSCFGDTEYFVTDVRPAAQ